MMAEIVIGASLAVSGFGILAPVRRDVLGWARVWVSIPIGAAVYLVVALTLTIVTGTLTPVVALGVTAGLGVVGLVATAFTHRPGLADVKWAGYTIGVAVLTVILARVLHLTRLTPDSLRYLLAANDLALPDAFEQVHRADLLLRQIGLPSLHTLSDLTDRRYMASIAPLFGVSGLGLFTWLAWRFTQGSETRRRMWLVVGAVLFLGSTNRLVYDSFYINSHIQMAVFLLIAVAGSWLAVTTDKPGWAWPAGLALAATLLMRPEAPLVVAVVMAAVAASRATWPVRWAMTLPSVVVMALWYGIALWQHANFGNRIALTAPVFGSLVAVFGATGVTLAGAWARARSVVRHLDLVALAGLALLVAGYGVRSPDVVVGSIKATFRNLTYDGMWMLTWVAALGLLAVALLVQRFADSRLWTVPILGFGLLYWLLPLIRDGAWRVGTGDSGNRILAHIIAVVVMFLVLAAVEPTEPEPGSGGLR
jgi:cytochrome c oxidase subunit IV